VDLMFWSRIYRSGILLTSWGNISFCSRDLPYEVTYLSARYWTSRILKCKLVIYWLVSFIFDNVPRVITILVYI
jgi:hypothetical protein